MTRGSFTTIRTSWLTVWAMSIGTCLTAAPQKKSVQENYYSQPVQQETQAPNYYSEPATDWYSGTHSHHQAPAASSRASTRKSSSSSRSGRTAQSESQQQKAYYDDASQQYDQAWVQQPAQHTQHQYAHSSQQSANYYDSAQSNTQTQSKRKSLGSMFKLPTFSRHSEPVVQQVSYLPSKYNGMEQTGTASWYGSDFHGGKTANGERYNMESMTAAHRTLPFGTLVKVENLSNGQECIVRINNRGPFRKNRIIDLSKGAARQLGFVGQGLCKVRMTVLGRQ